jgi:hypothetical protein
MAKVKIVKNERDPPLFTSIPPYNFGAGFQEVNCQPTSVHVLTMEINVQQT